MLVYPQLTTGALSQFPIVRRRSSRTVLNTAADGSRTVYADPAGASTEWRLSYVGLSDAELAALQTFHAAAEGSLNGFTFVDPAANLLAWSEELTNACWTPGPLLTLSGNVADPVGGSDAWHANNAGAGAQSIAQTLNVPCGYLYSFSVYVRSTQASRVTLVCGSNRAAFTALSSWSRIHVARTGEPGATSVTFLIELPTGAGLDLFGPQVEAQAAPSGYKTSTTGGVYENARLLDDSFRFTTTDVNRHSAAVTIFYANHL